MMFAVLVGFGVLIVRKLDGLPGALRRIAARERDDAAGAMKEAVAKRAGEALVAIRGHEQQLDQSLRLQLADAEARARVAERRAADTATALEAASTLVRDLRAALDSAAGLTLALAAQGSARPPGPPRPTSQPSEAPPAADEPTARDTLEMGAPPAPPVASANEDEDSVDDGANTTVGDRSAALKLVQRGRLIPAPGAGAKPRSVTVLPPAPGRDERAQ
jgi:hypothetical protein